MKTIDRIFFELLNKLRKYPQFDHKSFYLASGGIYDSKAPQSPSDVDVVYLVKDYTALEFLIKDGFEAKHQPEKHRCFYTKVIHGREVNILATDDKAALRSVGHRNTEIMLNKKFPTIAIAAITNKLNGDKTEPAYARALGAQIDPSKPDFRDPYELLLDQDECKKLATQRAKKIMKVMQASS